MSVDGRIFFVDGRQLSAIRTQDLGQLTIGICGFERGMVSVERCYKRQVAYVRLFGKNYEMFVLANDWAKIIPYLQDGALNPIIVAPQSRSGVASCAGSGEWTGRELYNIAVWDALFYQKVYATLQLVFTQSYPTSRL